MSVVPFGRAVELITDRSSQHGNFRIGLEAISKETGRLNFDLNVEYEGHGIAFQPGDVLFGKLRPNLAKAWLADRPGEAVGDFHVYRPREAMTTSRYLAYLVLSDPFLGPVVASVSGAKMPRADWSEVRNVKVWLPSAQEQEAIANYLDRETAQIDAFIAKNEELIATLKERKKSVTANAVTRGIDGAAKLKDTRIPWLGEIPEEWQAMRVKFAVNSQPGYAFSSSEFVEGASAIRLLRGINVGVQEIDWDETVSISTAPANISQTYTLHEGDLVMGMDRPLIRDGLRIAPVDRESSGTLLVQRVLRLRGVLVLNEYLNYSVAWGGFAMYVEPDFTGVSVPHMSEQQVSNYMIALPDLSTQQQIIAYLREQNSRMDKAIYTAGEAIELAKERRAALISAAVTGKIDVSKEASAV